MPSFQIDPQLFEFKDELGLDLKRHDLHYIPVTEFNCAPFISPSSLFLTIVEGSVDGLLLLRAELDALYICNLITREYFKLSNEGFVRSFATSAKAKCGFGVSKMTGQYKVVRIYLDGTCWSNVKFVCQVYTLGMGTWRSITPLAPVRYPIGNGAFVNGSLHWLVQDVELKDSNCFDVETESFSTFSHPPPSRIKVSRCLVVLGELPVYMC